ncbi:MAG: hypothetical protein WCF85_15195 [Rhodospirillaceae bacterium]
MAGLLVMTGFFYAETLPGAVIARTADKIVPNRLIGWALAEKATRMLNVFTK